MTYETMKKLLEIANSLSINLNTVSEFAQLHNRLKGMRVAS